MFFYYLHLSEERKWYSQENWKYVHKKEENKVSEFTSMIMNPYFLLCVEFWSLALNF